MAGFRRFEEIEGWQLARKLSLEIHALLAQPQLAKHFILRDQMSRACISIAANIAEGFAWTVM